VWRRLHVQGRRISRRARRRQKVTDSYPLFKKTNFFIEEIPRLFDDLVESTLLAGGKSQKKKMEI
jgi:hypothetical protein